MKKIIFTLFASLILLHVGYAQQISWNDSPEKTFVFEISNKEAVKLLKSKPKDSVVLKMLHTPVDSFSNTWSRKPTKGHFIFADIKKNMVGFSYAPVLPFQVFLFKEYGDLTIQVLDSNGNITSKAKVKLNHTRIDFDGDSKTYTIDDWSTQTDRILTVELYKFRAVFDLTKHLVKPSWYSNYGREGNRPDFYSYIITDKNKYKPYEVVRFKSYALSGNRRPIKKDLEVWVRTGKGYNAYKKITTVSPYHPGGFAGELKLDDSLKLTLDNYYPLQLRDKSGRIVASTEFKYEDYELFDNHLEVKLRSNSQFYPDSNKLEIKACDANGLLLKNVTAEVFVRRRDVLQSYVDVLQLPFDTLMHSRVNLENDKPTTFNIPPGIFGKSVCNYDVCVVVTTFENQRIEWRNGATFYYANYNIAADAQNDSLSFTLYESGREKSARATVSYDGKSEKIIQLPYKEKFNQAISSYNIRLIDIPYREIISAIDIDNGLDVTGGIANDSFKVQLINPLKLKVSWYIYQGGILLEKGSGSEMHYAHAHADMETAHYVEVFYSLGKQDQMLKRTFVPRENFLTVQADIPDRVYPGQKIDATIRVKDNYGNAVPNVDLSAFAVNSLLNYSLPDLPYYGAAPATREQRDSYSMRKKNYLLEVPLDYVWWNKKARLDELPYYQFTYPWDKMFTCKVSAPDTTTEFAPYVMKDGKAIDIYVIEQNNVPVYFSWTKQPKAYSFLVDTGKQKISMRLYNKALIFDSMRFEPGTKTIFSVDLDHLPKGVKVIELKNRNKNGNYIFTVEEENRYKKLISNIPSQNDRHYTYLKQDNQIYPVYLSCLPAYGQSVLTGPVPQGRTQFMDGIPYYHEGNFSYKYDTNVVYKYSTTVLPDYLRFSSDNNFSNLNDFSFTEKVLQRKLNESSEIAPHWNPRNIYIAKQNIALNVKLPVEGDASGISNLLFINRKANTVLYANVFNGGERYYPDIPENTYDIIVLYNDGKFLRYDNAFLKENYYTELNMAKLTLNEADSFSLKWLQPNLKQCYSDKPIAKRKEGHPDITQGQSVSTFIERRGYGNFVSGFVYGSNGAPIIAATVMIQGTSFGTVTDETGHFSIALDKPKGVLVISSVGFELLTINVSSGTNISVALKELINALEEVVVIGYGTQRKTSFTGAVVSISGDRIASAPPESLQTTLEGRVVGVSIRGAASLQNASEEFEVSEEAEKELYNELLTLNGLRSNFSDVGFWQPALYTDRKGQAKFSVTIPDNITSWSTVVYAMNRRLQTGTARYATKSYKPIIAELKTPQFLVTGDTSFFAADVRNYTKDSLITGSTTLSINENKTAQQNLEFAASHEEKLQVVASDKDSISASYLFTRNDGYKDGEKRTIAIIPQGTEMANGTLSIMRNGDTVSAKAGYQETVHVTITGDQLDVYMDATNFLKGYKYLCNEQLASRLIGLLNFRLYKEFREEKFQNDKQVNEIIKRLHDNQNSKKLWSWWGRADETSFWMSAHIMHALKMAKDAGYTVNTSFNEIEVDYTDISPYRGITINDIDLVHALSQWNTRQNYAVAIDTFQKLVTQKERYEDSLAGKIKNYVAQSYLKEKLLLWEMRQKYNLGYVSDSVRKYLKKDVLGKVYCDDGKNERYWYGDKLMNTLIAYRLIKNDTALQSTKEAMQLYIISTKSRGWNTYQASSAVADILPDLLKTSARKDKLATVILTGKENKEQTEFPYETTLLPGEQITVKKRDGMPLIYSAYQTQFVTNKRSGDAFEISTKIKNDSLISGKPTTLTATLTVKQKNAEYVMIEIPIPAGCSYNSKPNYFGKEVHREYFKEKTVIFCQSLPEGEYTFNIDLLPRFTGKYSLNPAKVELMYFPVTNANDDLRKVEIK